MPEQQTGSCLCQTVKFRLKAEVLNTVNCHCSICKKITGAAFETIAVVNEGDLEIFTGRDNLSTYRVSDKAEKHFCSICGTPIYNIHFGHPGRALIQIGALDEPASLSPTLNLHSENMFPWVTTLDDLKNFPQGFRK